MGARPDILMPVGERLRLWREKRGLSQLRLGVEAGTSARHLSCVETGRSRPSRSLVLRLAEYLEIPPQERNDMLLSAGYAPLHTHHDPASALTPAARAVVCQVLAAYGYVPAMAVDRDWNLVEANAGFSLFTHGAASWLLEPPVNVLRLSLHPEGLAPRIVNLAQWRADLLGRLRWRVGLTGDPGLQDLYEELSALPGPVTGGFDGASATSLVMPLTLRVGDRQLAFMCTPVVFGTPDNLSVSGLAIKSFLPADAETAAILQTR